MDLEPSRHVTRRLKPALYNLFKRRADALASADREL